MNSHTFTLSTLLITLIAFPAFATGKASYDWEQDKASLKLGGFIASRDTDIRIDSKTLGRGTEISAESDLGLDDDKNTLRVDAYIRFGSRHRVDASYYDLSRKSTRVIDRTFQYGDTTFTANTTLKSDFNFRIIKLSYAYSFLQNPTMELGLSAGLFVQDYNIVLNQIGGAGVRETADVIAPLPVIGLKGTWILSDKWWLRGSAEIFSLEYDTYDGRLTDIIVAMEHQTFKNVGFGIGYNNTRFKLIAEDDSFFGEVKLDYGGILVYTNIHF